MPTRLAVPAWRRGPPAPATRRGVEGVSGDGRGAGLDGLGGVASVGASADHPGERTGVRAPGGPREARVGRKPREGDRGSGGGAQGGEEGADGAPRSRVAREGRASTPRARTSAPPGG